MMVPQFDAVIGDLYEGTTNWRLWTRLGWQEVKRRYRRTVIGPFWTTASLAVFLVSLGFIWAHLWNQEPRQYMPYLSSGMLAWFLVSTCIAESCTMFVGAESLIKQVRLRYSIIVLTVIWRNYIVFAHNLIVYLFVMIWAGIGASWEFLLVIPGLIVIALNVTWMSILVALLCTRFRDVTQIVTSLIQIIMFVTPILYDQASLGPGMQVATHFNLIFNLVDLVRSPLLGKAPAGWSWIFSLGAAGIGWCVAIYIFGMFRRRVAYWL